VNWKEEIMMLVDPNSDHIAQTKRKDEKNTTLLISLPSS